MTVLDFKNTWYKYTTWNIIYTQLAHVGNKYKYAMHKTNQLKWSMNYVTKKNALKQ